MSASFHDKMKTLDEYISIIAAPLFHNSCRGKGYISHFKNDTFPLLFVLVQFIAVPLQFITDFLYFQHVSVVYYHKNFLLQIFIKRFYKFFFSSTVKITFLILLICSTRHLKVVKIAWLWKILFYFLSARVMVTKSRQQGW